MPNLTLALVVVTCGTRIEPDFGVWSASFLSPSEQALIKQALRTRELREASCTILDMTRSMFEVGEAFGLARKDTIEPSDFHAPEGGNPCLGESAPWC